MRFSAIFQLAAAPQETATPARQPASMAATPEPQQRTPAGIAADPQLPDDLDVRVRLIGEWQLGDAC